MRKPLPDSNSGLPRPRPLLRIVAPPPSVLLAEADRYRFAALQHLYAARQALMTRWPGYLSHSARNAWPSQERFAGE